MEDIELTDTPEIDIRILKHIDIKSLSRFCQINTYAKNLCNDNYF